MPDASLGAPKSLVVASTAFQHGKAVPREYTCEGRDVSPPLAWSGAPPGTQGYALIVDDPDAPGRTWTHWTVWDLPPGVLELDPGAGIQKLGGREGQADNGKVGYHGPCPPPGTHRYFFRVYALKESLRVPQGADLRAVTAALQGRVLAWGETMGTYRRS